MTKTCSHDRFVKNQRIRLVIVNVVSSIDAVLRSDLRVTRLYDALISNTFPLVNNDVVEEQQNT